MKVASPTPEGDTAEISALVESLHQTEKRLHSLTGGEVDSIADRHGRTFLLRPAQDSLRHSEAEKQAAILNALTEHMALLDTRGRIIFVNDAWRRFGRANGLQGPADAIGVNYLSICDAACVKGSPGARGVSEGLRNVLSGAAEHYSIEYPCHSPTEQRWFKLTATPLVPGRPQGIVVMHTAITQERATRERLRASESRFRQMAQNIRDVFFLHSIDGSQIQYLSPAYERIWGRTCESAYASPASWLGPVHPDDLEKLRTGLRVGESGAGDFDYRLIRSDGEVRWINVRSVPVLNNARVPYRIAGVASDITARKETERKIERLNRFHAMLSGINSLIVRVTGRDELFRQACRIAVEAGGFKMAWIGVIDPQTLDGKVVAWCGGDGSYVSKITLTARETRPASDRPECRALRQSRPVVVNNIATSAEPPWIKTELLDLRYKSAASFPLTMAGRVGAVLTLLASEPDVFDEEESSLLVSLAGNVSFVLDHLEKAEQLNYAAYYDPLTGLANRLLFFERVAQYARSAATAGGKMALCVFDVEHFKNINDTFGDLAGDALLKQVAGWLTADVGDANLLARVVADQFAIVLPDVKDAEDVMVRMEHTTGAFLDHPFAIASRIFHIAAKAGVALFPDDGDSAAALFANAESALKKAKAGGDRLLFYAQKMTETVTVRLTLEFRLRHALEQEEFVLHYQPKVNLLNGRLTGAEALIRWNDPQSGLMPPGRFIPLLEETGLIWEVGRWALHKAIGDFLRWRAAGHNAVRIAVNVSPVQLRHRGFIAEILHAIGGGTDAASGLELELTESLVMGDVKHSIASLKAIRDMGVRVAIDDFGTGFSSLSYLAKLPVDTLKIDRSFITDMVVGPEGVSLVSAIITLAHSLRLNVVAEGVETKTQSRLLRTLNCDEVQGFLFGRPVPADVFEATHLVSAENR